MTFENRQHTRLLQNAKVMARERQGEAAVKVMFMERIHSGTAYFKQFGYCSEISVAFLYLKATSDQNTTQGEMKENEKCQKVSLHIENLKTMDVAMFNPCLHFKMTSQAQLYKIMEK